MPAPLMDDAGGQASICLIEAPTSEELEGSIPGSRDDRETSPYGACRFEASPVGPEDQLKAARTKSQQSLAVLQNRLFVDGRAGNGLC